MLAACMTTSFRETGALKTSRKILLAKAEREGVEVA
jgi:hypothetical protein